MSPPPAPTSLSSQPGNRVSPGSVGSPLDAAPERPCIGDTNLSPGEEVVQGIPEVVARYPRGVSRVVDPTSVAEESRLVDGEDVRRADRSVLPDDDLLLISQVGEVEPLRPRPLDHLGVTVLRVALFVVGVYRDELHPSRGVISLD